MSLFLQLQRTDGEDDSGLWCCCEAIGVALVHGDDGATTATRPDGDRPEANVERGRSAPLPFFIGVRFGEVRRVGTLFFP
nr:hypothetical protein Itr_chr03CG04570 [Ipomoea trifida]